MFEYIKDLFTFIKVSIFRPKQKELERSNFGLNAFYNNPHLGLPKSQSQDIESLGVSNIRLLFHWDDTIQPKRNGEINFSFYDSIMWNLPKNASVVIVLNGRTTWAKDSQDFLDYIKSVVLRYSNFTVKKCYQIGNEPNQVNSENKFLGFNNPEVYASFCISAASMIKFLDPKSSVTNAATTSIIQDFSKTIRYNQILLKNKIHEYVDYFSFHYYGEGYFNFYRPGGAYRLLKSVKIPLLLTEFGIDDPNKHLQYAKEKLPYLLSLFPNLVCGFWYQYDGSGTTENYGIRTFKRKTNLYKYLKGE